MVKDLVLSLQGLGSLLWHRFDPWPGNFHSEKKNLYELDPVRYKLECGLESLGELVTQIAGPHP